MDNHSKLTLQKPELWANAIKLATSLTGYQWVPKLPSNEGVIYACGGGGGNYTPDYEKIIADIDSEISYYEDELKKEKARQDISNRRGVPFNDSELERLKEKIIEKKRQREQVDRRRIEKEIEDDKRRIGEIENGIEYQEIEEEVDRKTGDLESAKMRRGIISDYKREIKKRRERLENNTKSFDSCGVLLVPEGAMEWLLHEVGHWLAATREERALPNYGFGIIRDGECTCTKDFTECRCGDEREWQAWAFEGIILAPFGDARNFAPPPHRGGIAFYKNEPIPDWAYRHIEQKLSDDSVDIGEWRNLWDQWVRWGSALGGKAPWKDCH